MINHPMINKRKLTLTLSIILGVVFAILFFEIISTVAKGLFTLQDSFGLLIILISIYIIWTQRYQLIKLHIRPNIPMGAALVIVGCLILLVGKLTFTLLIQGVSLINTLLGLIWLIMGNDYLKVLLLPVGYLLFMFSLIEELLGNFSIYLQHLAAWIASSMLKFIGMPVLLSGRFIALPHITLEVAKVCCGINHIIALVALAVPLAILTQPNILRQFLLIIFAFFTGIFANGLRVALIGIWTIYHGSESIHGPFELLYVSFILFFGLFLVLASSIFSKKLPSKNKDKGTIDKQSSKKVIKKSDQWLHPLSLGVAIAILLITFGNIFLFKTKPVFLKKSLYTFPKAIGQWKGQDVLETDWPIKQLTADVQLKRIYRDNSKFDIGLYIGYYPLQSQDKEIVNDSLNWLYNRSEDECIQQSNKMVCIKKALPRGMESQTFKNDPRSFYFWYDINGEILTDRYKTKLATLINNLWNKRTNGAMVIITVNDEWTKNKEADKHAIKFIRTALPVIKDHL